MSESPVPSAEPRAAVDASAEKPLDVDGVTAAISGTIAFAIAFVILLFFRSTLAKTDGQWWLWVCATGAGLGVIGIVYGIRRRAAYRAASQVSE